jgi:uncharacterized protein (DUF362 family)
MSVSKMLSRMGGPSVVSSGEEAAIDPNTLTNDSSYSIATDPLTQFACIFAALIHDVSE